MLPTLSALSQAISWRSPMQSRLGLHCAAYWRPRHDRTKARQCRCQFARRKAAIQQDQRMPLLLKLDGHLDRQELAGFRPPPESNSICWTAGGLSKPPLRTPPVKPPSDRSHCIAGVQPVRCDKPLRVTADCQQSPKALFDGGGMPLETLARFESLLGAGFSCLAGWFGGGIRTVSDSVIGAAEPAWRRSRSWPSHWHFRSRLTFSRSTHPYI